MRSLHLKAVYHIEIVARKKELNSLWAILLTYKPQLRIHYARPWTKMDQGCILSTFLSPTLSGAKHKTLNLTLPSFSYLNATVTKPEATTVPAVPANISACRQEWSAIFGDSLAEQGRRPLP